MKVWDWGRYIAHRVRCWWQKNDLLVWHAPCYRLPITSLGARTQLEPRRADFVRWYWLHTRMLEERQFHHPHRIPYKALARIHPADYLESLQDADTLAQIFSVDAWDLPVEEVLRAQRVACSGTWEAARASLQSGGVGINLMGGFHHAAPSHGSGMCVFNDIAVAIAALREEGLEGLIAILDLDAHPPSGLVACLPLLSEVWLGSLSASQWGALDGECDLTQILLPKGCDDSHYLRELEVLLSQMPKPVLAFVIAGGDVLAGDRMGGLGLSLDGARRRDLRVAQALAGVPMVWVPGGGYHPDAWRLLAGTGMVLAMGSLQPIPPQVEPLHLHWKQLSKEIGAAFQADTLEITEDDILSVFGAAKTPRFLNFYTRENIEYALYRYGILDYLRRVGYDHFEVDIASKVTGDRLRLLGEADGRRYLLVECVLEKVELRGEPMLYIHWLTLRHPRAQFSPHRPSLPGQEVPGLGLAKETGELFELIAHRIGCRGVAFQPAWFHIAFAMRRRFRFIEPTTQGRFEALCRDLADIPLKDATHLIADGHVLCHGEPYQWEPEIMAILPPPDAEEQQKIDRVREQTHFSVREPQAAETSSDKTP